MGPGAGFGELAILYGQRRSATIKALEDCKCYTLSSEVFKQVVNSDETRTPTKGDGTGTHND